VKGSRPPQKAARVSGRRQCSIELKIEDAQPGVGGVARQQDDIHRLEFRRDGIEPEQPFDEGKGLTFGQDLLLPFDLMFAISRQALFTVDAIALP
jgi:hypothetical protein